VSEQAVPSAARPAAIDPTALAVVVGLGAAALAADIATGGDVAATVGVLLAVGVMALVWVIPLRWSVTALLVLGATLEAPYEAFAAFLWRTPWNIVGQILLGNLNLTTHVSAMKFSGFDLMMVYLLVIHGVRRAQGNEIDSRGTVPLARPMIIGASISMATMLALWVWGLANGGSFFESLLQIQRLVYAVLLMVLMHGAYRGSKDLRTLGIALVGSAMYRALLATFVHFRVRLPDGAHLPCSTTHADSRLFAAALLLLIVMMNERVRGSTHWSRFVAAGVILLGMVLNHRRLVWVALAGGLLVVALVSAWTPLKRRVARAAVMFLPVGLLYVAIGWNNPYSTVFRPVATIRSILDSKSDGSTLWRDLENMNLALNVSAHPFWGVGFGHEYVEHIHLPDVSQAYPRFKYVPHNSLVALFPFAGPAGVAGVFAMLLATVFLAARTYHGSAQPAVRAAAMLSIVLIYLHMNQSYGDIGVSEWLTTFTLAPAMLMAGKLSVESGAWRWTPRRSSLRILTRRRAQTALSGLVEGAAR
jgi:hypothetical protein